MATKENTNDKKEEKFEVRGEEAMKKIKEIIAEGNVRSITISDKQGNKIATFPLTVGVIGALLAPPLAAIGAIVALLSECTISVERR